MFDSDELDHELDRLIDGEPVGEGDSLPAHSHGPEPGHDLGHGGRRRA